jgi:MtN3 and saliva related transmembrane protein
MFSNLLGYVAAALAAVAFVPQAVKTIRSRDTEAISLWMYVLFTIGQAFWLAYGMALNSWPHYSAECGRARTCDCHSWIKVEIQLKAYENQC